MIDLKPKYIKLLKKCIENQRKDLLYLIESNKKYKIDSKLGNELRNDIIGNELMQHGITNGEINEYGIQLDRLIDEIGHFYLSKDAIDKKSPK